MILRVIYLILFLFPFFMEAQDTLLFNNGSFMLTQIVSEDDRSVSYVRRTYPQGPKYIIGKGMLKGIRYSKEKRDSIVAGSLGLDTIFLLNGKRRITKVTEIGPMFVSFDKMKDDAAWFSRTRRIFVKKIIYADAFVDTFSLDLRVKADTKMRVSGEQISLRGRTLNDEELQAAINATSDKSKLPQFQLYLKDRTAFRKKRKIFVPLCLVAGVACLFAGGSSSTESGQWVGLSGATFFSGGAITIAGIYAKKSRVKTRQIADLYNNP